MKNPRIAFFGSGLVSAYQTEKANYFRGIIRALGNRGRDVTFYEPDISGSQRHWDLQDPLWSKFLIYSPKESEISRALAAAGTADVLVKVSRVGIFDELLESAVLQVRSPHTTVIFWDADPSGTLERIQNDAKDPFRLLIPKYDLILTRNGTQRHTEKYLQLGARACVAICDALDPHTHHPALPDSRYSGDLGLLVNNSSHGVPEAHELFLKAAEFGCQFKFVLGGAGWLGKPFRPNVRCVGHVFARDYNAFNSTLRAVLNAGGNEDEVADSRHSQIFEAAGAAACVITQPFVGLERILEPQREVLVARDAGELVEHLHELHPSRAREIGKAARKRMLSEQTYDNRVRQLEEILGLAAPALPPIRAKAMAATLS